MTADLHLSVQVPSQMVVRKVGAPIWLSFLVIGWGIVAAATAAIKTVGQFYAMRFLLGIFESGKHLPPTHNDPSCHSDIHSMSFICQIF